VGLFYGRALVKAGLTRDSWSIVVSSKPRELVELVRLSEGRRQVVEIGTGAGWTALALALSDERLRVRSLDPVDRAEPAVYAELVDSATRDRVEFQRRFGEDPPDPGSPRADLLFIDGSHSRDDTAAAFRAWRDHLVPRARIVFHDYGDPSYPGVAEAVVELGLRGRAVGRMFVCDGG